MAWLIRKPAWYQAGGWWSTDPASALLFDNRADAEALAAAIAPDGDAQVVEVEAAEAPPSNDGLTTV